MLISTHLQGGGRRVVACCLSFFINGFQNVWVVSPDELWDRQLMLFGVSIETLAIKTDCLAVY